MMFKGIQFFDKSINRAVIAENDFEFTVRYYRDDDLVFLEHYTYLKGDLDKFLKVLRKNDIKPVFELVFVPENHLL